MTLAAPNQYSDLRSWMREANTHDLHSWLSESPEDYRMFAPIGRHFKALIRRLPSREKTEMCVEYQAPCEYLNPWKNVHGGILLGLIDEVSSTAAAFVVGPKNFGATTTVANSFILPLRDPKFFVSAELVGRSLTSLSMRARVIGTEGRIHNDALIAFSIRSALSVRLEADLE